LVAVVSVVLLVAVVVVVFAAVPVVVATSTAAPAAPASPTNSLCRLFSLHTPRGVHVSGVGGLAAQFVWHSVLGTCAG
jgi:hypothetical protein